MVFDNDKNLFIPEPLPPKLLAAARTLRQNMTDAELLLWSLLRRQQLGGFRFRRQHPFGNYILDFYCCNVHLGIELDGGQHNAPGQRALDQRRTEELSLSGICVLRFWNSEVFNNTVEVLQKIYDSAVNCLEQPPS